MWTTVRHVTGVMLVCALLATVLGLAAVFYLVRAHGWLVQTVATGSMEPSVPSGSVIVSRPVDPLEVDVGDVIVFWSPTGATVSGGSDGAFQTTESTLITHRVVSIHGDGAERTFRTKGDGNEEETRGASPATWSGHGTSPTSPPSVPTSPTGVCAGRCTSPWLRSDA